jgi:putative FmdB family regulatory protein
LNGLTASRREREIEERGMPTYDYLCTKCGHQFEEIQKMSDPVLTKCPQCKGRLKRLIGAGVGIIFKGSGFYSTDSRKASSATVADTKKESASAKETPKSEPAAKAAESSSTKPDTSSGKG